MWENGLGGGPRDRARRLSLLIEVALLLANLALKLPGLAQSIWLDEAITLHIVQQPLSYESIYTRDSTPPGYYSLLRPWVLVVGSSEVAVRSFSVLASAFTAPLLFRLGRRFLGWGTGLVAAILFTASPLQFHYAQEARCYALVGLLCAISFHLFLDLFSRPRKSVAVGLAVTNALLVQTHYLAALGLLAQLAAAAVGIRRRAAVRMYVGSQMLAVVLSLPWAVFVWSHWPPLTPDWLSPPASGSVHVQIGRFLGSPLPLWSYAAVVALWATSLLRRRKTNAAPHVLALIGLWAFGPVLLAYWISHAVMPIFLTRYQLYASLGLNLLVAYVVTHVPLGRWVQGAVAAVFVGAALSQVGTDPGRPDWKVATAFARIEEGRGAAIVLTPHYLWWPFAYYFDPEAFRDAEHTVERLEHRGIHMVPPGGSLASLLSSRPARILILSGHGAEISPSELERAGYRPSNAPSVAKIRVESWKLDSETAQEHPANAAHGPREPRTKPSPHPRTRWSGRSGRRRSRARAGGALHAGRHPRPEGGGQVRRRVPEGTVRLIRADSGPHR